MTVDATSTRLESEIRRVVDLIEQVEDWPQPLNEANTKAALIDPILTALGWDLRDPFSVSQEYRHKSRDNPVDYALFALRAPALFVEAKALDKDLSDYKWITQTLAYANAAGVAWCVLTNGNEYRIYNTFAKAEAEKKVFRRVSLTDRDERGFCIETLLLLSQQQMAEKQIDVLWKAYFVDRQVREAVSEIFREPDPALVRTIIRRTQDLSPGEVRDSLRRADMTVRFPTMVSNKGACRPASPSNGATADVGDASLTGVSSGRSGRTKISDLLSAGVIQAPTYIEVTFKSQKFQATIEADGLIHFDGETYSSPSHAGGMVRNKVNGPPPDERPYWSTNGWTFWRYTDPESGQAEPISTWLKHLPD
jgi:predicted type IV restriction endonuclease